MDLSHDELRLIEEFRKLPPSLRDELLAHASVLIRKIDTEVRHESESSQNQCRLKSAEARPETKEDPIITE
jgi:hypothetical protein